MTEIHGTVSEGYERIRDEFAAFVAGEHADPEAQLAVYRGDRLVVDLWSGEQTTGDSVTGVFSITKGAAHTVLALLVQDGLIDLDAPVTRYWPEFPAPDLTVRQLASHQSGLINTAEGLSAAELADDALIASLLAESKPFWEPGTAFGYHAVTIGALTGEIVRRVTGRSLQEAFAERVRAPHGFDFWLGLPADQEHRHLPVLPPEPTPEQAEYLAAHPIDPAGLLAAAFGLTSTPPLDLVSFANSPLTKANGPASAGGVGNARGVAAFYASTHTRFNGRPALLTPDTITTFTRPQVKGVDVVEATPDHFLVGFENLASRYPVGDRSYGHLGAAGTLAFADPDRSLSYAYIRRRVAVPTVLFAENTDFVAALPT